MLVDVTTRGLTGKIAEAALGRGDHGEQELDPVRCSQADGPERRPHRHAGLDHARMKEDAIRQVAAWITAVLSSSEDQALARWVRGEIKEFARDYPVPADAVAALPTSG